MIICSEILNLQKVIAADIDGELEGLIEKRLHDLSDYEECNIFNLIHFLVIEPSDSLTHVDVELGFSLVDHPWDVIESHSDWYEITVVVSDDGFGWVIYVPKHASTDATLLEKCASYCKESMP